MFLCVTIYLQYYPKIYDEVVWTHGRFKDFKMRKTLARKLHFYSDHTYNTCSDGPECMNMRLAIFENIQCLCCENQGEY